MVHGNKKEKAIDILDSFFRLSSDTIRRFLFQFQFLSDFDHVGSIKIIDFPE